jgi:hypothetical protein
MSNAELCPARRHVDEDGERFACIRESGSEARGAWGFVCWRCWNGMLDGRTRRMEWRTEP